MAPTGVDGVAGSVAESDADDGADVRADPLVEEVDAAAVVGVAGAGAVVAGAGGPPFWSASFSSGWFRVSWCSAWLIGGA